MLAGILLNYGIDVQKVPNNQECLIVFRGQIIFYLWAFTKKEACKKAEIKC